MTSRWGALCLAAAVFGGCGDDSSSAAGATGSDADADAGLVRLPDVRFGSDDRYSPAPGVSWYWQLQGVVPLDVDAELVDIDLFDTTEATIGALRDSGHRVICYFSAGSHEDWRPDAAGFPNAAIGDAMDGWPGERWLDTRHPDVRNRMIERLDLAVTKGCDGVEPDNVDGYLNQTGFDLDRDDTVEYLGFLVDAARARDLSIGLKNLPELADALEPLFDWALTEQCVEFDECGAFAAFIDAGKAVLHVEYVDSAEQIGGAIDAACGAASTVRFSTAVATWDLDGAWLECP
jgi:hypothetical protein